MYLHVAVAYWAQFLHLSDSVYFLLHLCLKFLLYPILPCDSPKQLLYSLTKHIHSIQRGIPHYYMALIVEERVYLMCKVP